MTNAHDGDFDSILDDENLDDATDELDALEELAGAKKVDDDDESESDVGWPTEHPVKRKNERRGSRPRGVEAAATSLSSAEVGAMAQRGRWPVGRWHCRLR